MKIVVKVKIIARINVVTGFIKKLQGRGALNPVHPCDDGYGMLFIARQSRRVYDSYSQGVRDQER